MSKYTRSQMAQITSRVRKGSVTEFRGGNTKCLICGRPFLGNDCTHTAEENRKILTQVLKNL